MSTRTRRACTACTKAKRSCSKQTPRCSRCQHRNLNCTYPPRRPTAWDYAISTAEADVPSSERVTSTPPSPDTPMDGDGEGRDATTQTVIARSLALSLQDDWFYGPDSWAITRGGMRSSCATEQLEAVALKGFIAVVQQWLQQWVCRGSCPFIHHRLYSRRLPVPVQDAFTALSTYLSRTADTTDMCLSIIRTRITSLVSEANNPSSESRPGTSLSNMALLDPFNHLARVQALLVYQIIGLWDGDVSLRNLSEQYISFLFTWANEMLECVELESSVYFVMQQDQEITRTASHEDLEQMTWQRWILCESIRRTWMLVLVTQGIYTALKQGWSHCDGGVKITTQAGAWDADDAFTWGQALARSSRPLLSPALEAFALVDNTGPEDVDDFAHTIIEMQCTKEKMARWKASSAGSVN